MELKINILDEDANKLFEIMEHEKVSMSTQDFAREVLISEIKKRYRDIKNQKNK